MFLGVEEGVSAVYFFLGAHRNGSPYLEMRTYVKHTSPKQRVADRNSPIVSRLLIMGE